MPICTLMKGYFLQVHAYSNPDSVPHQLLVLKICVFSLNYAVPMETHLLAQRNLLQHFPNMVVTLPVCDSFLLLRTCSIPTCSSCFPLHVWILSI